MRIIASGERHYAFWQTGALVRLPVPGLVPFRVPRGTTELRYSEREGVHRVDDRVVAVALPDDPREASAGRLAEAARAPCVLWRVAGRVQASTLALVRCVAPVCLSVAITGAKPDEILQDLLSLRNRIRALKVSLGMKGLAVLPQFKALEVLGLEVTDESFWASQPPPEQEPGAKIRKGPTVLERLPRLTSLEISGRSVPAGEEVGRLLPPLPRLRRLRLVRTDAGALLNRGKDFPSLLALRGTVGMSHFPLSAARPPLLRELLVEGLNASHLPVIARLTSLAVFNLQTGYHFKPASFEEPQRAPEPITPLAALRNLRVLLLPPGEKGVGLGAVTSKARKLVVLRAPGVTIDATEVANLGELSDLEELDLSGSRLDRAPLPDLSRLTHLVRLKLDNTRADDVTLRRIAAVRTLRHLDLTGARVSAAALRGLGALTEIESLSLAATLADDGVVEGLANHRSLRRLDLGFTAISDAGLGHLARLSGLEWLSLRATRVTAAGLAGLASLSRLRHLDLGLTGANDTILDLLSRLTSLTWLSLRDTPVAFSAGSLRFPSLSYLDLGYTDLGPKAVRKLRGLKALRELRLEGIAVENDLPVLVALPNLEVLDLSFTLLDEVGFNVLGGAYRLREVCVGGTQVTPEAAWRWQQKHPGKMVCGIGLNPPE